MWGRCESPSALSMMNYCSFQTDPKWKQNWVDSNCPPLSQPFTASLQGPPEYTHTTSRELISSNDPANPKIDFGKPWKKLRPWMLMPLQPWAWYCANFQIEIQTCDGLITTLTHWTAEAVSCMSYKLHTSWTYYKWTVYDLSFFDHDDRHRHLAVRILMTTSKWLDNDDYCNHVTSLTKETFPPFTV